MGVETSRMEQHTRIKPSTTRNARNLRREMTDAERALWRHLRGQQVAGYKFRRQHPLGAYIVDFVCLDALLVIEVDGGQHAERQRYDQERTDWLQQRGYRVLRFWNHEVLANGQAVMEAIGREVQQRVLPPS